MEGLKNVGYSENLNFETFAQVLPAKNLDIELVPVFLRAIREVGEIFAKHIEA